MASVAFLEPRLECMDIRGSRVQVVKMKGPDCTAQEFSKSLFSGTVPLIVSGPVSSLAKRLDLGVIALIRFDSMFTILNNTIPRSLADSITTPEVEARVSAALERLSQRPVVICCASTGGHTLIELLRTHGISPVAVADNDPNKHGTQFEGLSVIPIEKTVSLFGQEITVIIASLTFYDPIRMQLLALGLPPERICYGGILARSPENPVYNPIHLWDYRSEIDWLFGQLEDVKSRQTLTAILRQRQYGPLFDDINTVVEPNQYFPEDLVSLSDQEVFVDGGAFTGDTIASFLRVVPKGRYSAIHAFEPCETVFATLSRNLEQQHATTLYRKGLFEHSTSARLRLNASGCSSLDDTGQIHIEVVSVDSLGIAPTFVKMDVEGAELAALRGMQDTIRAHRPQMAVCVYHKYHDLWQIPKFLKELVPDYRIAIRHHSITATETVCYACV